MSVDFGLPNIEVNVAGTNTQNEERIDRLVCLVADRDAEIERLRAVIKEKDAAFHEIGIACKEMREIIKDWG